MFNIIRRIPRIAAASSSAGADTLSAYDAYLTAYWPLGDELDAVGSNDLTNTASIPFSTGFYGDAANKDRTDYGTPLRAASTADLIPVDNMAVSCWFYPSSMPDLYHYIVNKGTTSYVLEHHSTYGFRFSVIEASPPYTRAAYVGATSSTGAWYHLVGIADGSQVLLYVNGTKYSGGAYDGTIGANGDELRLQNAANMLCLLDEVALWKGITFSDGAARDAFAAALYNSGDGRFRVGGEWVEPV